MGEFVKFFTPMKSFVENFILLIIEANNAWRVWSQRSHANRFIKLQTMKKKEVKLKRTKGVLESVIYIKTSSSNILITQLDKLEVCYLTLQITRAESIKYRVAYSNISLHTMQCPL